MSYIVILMSFQTFSSINDGLGDKRPFSALLYQIDWIMMQICQTTKSAKS